MMKRLYSYFLMGCLLLAACSDDGVETSGTEPGGSDNEDVGNNPPSALTGYADPDGVMILSGGTYTLENAFLTFINPKGEEEDDRTRRLPAINTNVLIQKEKRKEHKTLAGNRY